MRWVRGIAALVAMVVVIVGAPVVLLGWGRVGGPGWWRADDGSLLLSVLTVAGWLAWLVFTLATGAELLRYFSGNRFVVNLPLLGGLQAVCAGLVFAVLALAATSGGHPPPAGTRTEPPVPTAPATPATTRAVPVRPSPRATPVALPTPATLTAEPANAADGGTGYLVEAGDDLWSIAERLLGDGRRWRELARANPDALSDPTRQLEPGTRLSVPVQQLAEQVRTEPPPTRITVVKGDTLSELAEEHLGRASLWPRIAAANDELINDPDHIEIGWELVLPVAGSGALEDRSDGAGPSPSGPPPGEPGVPPADDGADDPDAPAPLPVDPTPLAEATTAPPLPVTPTGPPDTGEVGPPQPTSPAREPEASGESEAADTGPDVGLAAGLSVLAAAGLMGGWHSRRLLQHRVRQPGRRIAQPTDDLARFQAALGHRQAPDHATTLDVALRAIGRHHHLVGLPLPALAQVTISPVALRFQWAEPAGQPPPGFGGDQTVWLVDLAADPGTLAADSHPCPFPALVSLGTTPGGETVMVDVERSGVLGVAADTEELQRASLASMVLELGCAPWASEVSLVVVGGDGGLARAAGESVSWLPDSSKALAQFRQRHASRSRALGEAELRRLRVDPDRAEAVAPQVYVFQDAVSEPERELLDRLLDGRQLGLAAVVPAEVGADAAWELFGDPLSPTGRLAGGDQLAAHAVPDSTRAAVESLYRVAERTDTEPAPWWAVDEDSANVRHLPPRETSEDLVDIVNLRRAVRPHPTLLLIGPIDLTGAAGPEPGRARQQLIEMCSWLLEHPGRTASQMAAGLGIAESTRRSNMSRLRSWLGSEPDGEQYLPDAYSGRIRLHPEVTSDVLRLRLLTGPGINRISEHGLVAALDLIRGGILADAAPGQWFWAEELRSDISSILRDAGLVLVDRALTRGDIDLARWAAKRALVVAPEDELLMCARIRTEHAAGNRPAVERYVLRLSQQARTLGVDLLPETVMLCQQVMEGRPRARRA